ncbi:hypothetical protein T458_18770 [Brevibacillus panacihumi W25]|uniref:Uncharacterized protein n=1 Tax=Brevibacillus panacihumi W25 TaxID=1408254 RepID=V6MEP6_9BACL|nr:hypothetical protein T458_18770 [Brevibacillus panacihumi W25]
MDEPSGLHLMAFLFFSFLTKPKANCKEDQWLLNWNFVTVITRRYENHSQMHGNRMEDYQ